MKPLKRSFATKACSKAFSASSSFISWRRAVLSFSHRVKSNKSLCVIITLLFPLFYHTLCLDAFFVLDFSLEGCEPVFEDHNLHALVTYFVLQKSRLSFILPSYGCDLVCSLNSNLGQVLVEENLIPVFEKDWIALYDNAFEEIGSVMFFNHIPELLRIWLQPGQSLYDAVSWHVEQTILRWLEALEISKSLHALFRCLLLSKSLHMKPSPHFLNSLVHHVFMFFANWICFIEEPDLKVVLKKKFLVFDLCHGSYTLFALLITIAEELTIIVFCLPF